MTLTQLIYASQPFGFDDLALAGILSISRQNNRRDRITGALICREDLYLQLLEGDSAAVLEAYSRILRDDRHSDIVKIWSGGVAKRLFPDWDMRHDPARSWMWSKDEVGSGAVLSASTDAVRNVFDRLSQEPASHPQL